MIIYQSENFGKHYEYRSNPHTNWAVLPHMHEFSELAFVREGVATVFVNGEKHEVRAGQLIFILPNQIHEYSDETASKLRCAVFSNDFVPAFFDAIKEQKPKNPVIDLVDAEYLLDELDEVDPSSTLKICGILNLICDKVLRSGELVPQNAGEHHLLCEVVSYISQNFLEDICLGDIAKKLGYHEKYLSSSLHSLIGMNFRTFLASYRVNFAKHLLRSKDSASLRISDIALRSGFSSINSFNRAFRDITGITPTEYRKRKYK